MEETNKRNYSTLFFICTTIILAALLIIGKMNLEKTEQYNSTTVLSKIVHIQELALVKHNYNGVIGYKDFMKFLNINIPMTEKYFLLKYNGYIKAGVDFNRIKVDVNDTSVHVTMPKARITDIVIDENSVQVYDESENAFNPIKISDYNEALKSEKETMRRDALNQGILRDANQQAELAITSLLEEMGFENITVSEEITIQSVN